MNYELAKELKDLDFWSEHSARTSEYPDKDGFVPPDLSELIEACGDEFDLTNCKGCVSSRGCKEPWIAEKWYGTDKPQDIAQGKTREEAVARLWLKLNE